MTHGHTPAGVPFFKFQDRHGEQCSLQLDPTHPPSIWLGVCGARMSLTQDQVKELLPYLQSFADTGTFGD